jgi:hypothetical protein
MNIQGQIGYLTLLDGILVTTRRLVNLNSLYLTRVYYINLDVPNYKINTYKKFGNWKFENRV